MEGERAVRSLLWKSWWEFNEGVQMEVVKSAWLVSSRLRGVARLVRGRGRLLFVWSGEVKKAFWWHRTSGRTSVRSLILKVKDRFSGWKMLRICWGHRPEVGWQWAWCSVGRQSLALLSLCLWRCKAGLKMWVTLSCESAQKCAEFISWPPRSI